MNVFFLQDKQECCGCHACASACPRHCIEMKEDDEGFLYPHIDEELCVDCGLCKASCPVLNSPKEPQGNLPDSYAAINLDEEIRLDSSSGGVFTALAETTISKGGIVFGAAFMENLQGVHHIGVETVEDLALFRGSKYMESVIGTAFQQAKNYLEQGREVLFSGTPCQIEGLRSFLKREYKRLLCVDLICYGVPSPKVWRKYIVIQKRNGVADIASIKFRAKDFGWKNFNVHINRKDGSAYIQTGDKDEYMTAFSKNICLRPSCHQCHFKKTNRVSDLTIADFWGIEDVLPEMDDDKGTSLVLVHSRKGKVIQQEILDKVRFEFVDFAQAIRKNMSINYSMKPNLQRESFFDDLDRWEYRDLVSRYVNNTIHNIINTDGLNGKRIVLYAAGKCGKDAYAQLNYFGYNVVAWLDRYWEKHLVKNYPVGAPETIQNLDYDVVVIAVVDEKLADSIKDRLLKMGVPEEKLYWKAPLVIV